MTDRSPLRSATPGDEPGPLRPAVPRSDAPISGKSGEPPAPVTEPAAEPEAVAERAEPVAPAAAGAETAVSEITAVPEAAASTPVAQPTSKARHRARSAPSRALRATGRVLVSAVPATGRGAVRAGRSIGRWARRPSGRFVVPVLALGVVLSAVGTAGAYVVPAAAPSPTPTHASPSPSVSIPPGDLGSVPGGLDPSGAPPLTNPSGAPPTGTPNPVDGLRTWAQKYTGATGIPVIALEAYGYAALVEAQRSPTCHLAWTTLGGIGKIESDHGRENGAATAPDGSVLPPIIGAPLDGQGGRQLVKDTDSGTLDGDRTYDHAVGPMQFVPATWERYQQDANQDGKADINNIEDAALAAADYLCAGQRDLSTAGGWWAAVLSYNALQSYAQNVFDAANDYGIRSRAVA